MVGLELPSKGSIWVDNSEITKFNNEDRTIFRAKKIGMVYQLWYWIKSLNVWENVAMPLYILGYDTKEAKTKALYGLEQIGMQDFANKKPVQLSGGEQQRVGLARALINNPEIIVADEPTGNLDTASADKIMQFIQNLHLKQGRTVVMVTHNLVYLPMANKTIAMRDGQVVTSDHAGRVQGQIKKEASEGVE
jgi:putative ABC transport system ATP-binding protein